MLGFVEASVAVCTIMPPALAVSDGLRVAFESFTDRTACNCGPTGQIVNKPSNAVGNRLTGKMA